MNGKYTSAVQKLIDQQPFLEPNIFATKVSKIKSQLKQKIFETKQEIDSISHKTSVIETRRIKEVPQIAREKEMLKLLSALYLYYESKIRTAENEKKRYDDLRLFEEEIISKYIFF